MITDNSGKVNIGSEEKDMTRYNEEYELTQELLDEIATYMNDEIREDLHLSLAPCEPIKFLEAYVEKDPDFEDLLKSEFSIEL